MIIKTLAILILALLNAPNSFGQDAYTRIPAKFLFALGAEGTALNLEQTQRIRQDRRAGEIFLTDTGHNRIVILNADGNYLFDFCNQDKLTAPTDIAVDSEGRMYVLCFSVDSSPIQVFDYNGDYLHPFKINGGPQADSIGVASLAIDEQDRMYLADEMGVRILCCNLSGDYVSGFGILDGLKDKVRREQMLGAIHLDGDLIYVSTPMIGSVYCYNKQGTLVKMVGRNGGGYGELAFPTAVSTDVQGNVLVLDKHRHMVISYDSTGKVNGEFGGLGRNPGWFYHPTAMLVDTRNRVWVAQGFRNLLQVLQLPLPEETAPAPKERTIVVDR